MYKLKIIGIIAIIVLIGIVGCKKTPPIDQPHVTTPYSFKIPAGFPLFTQPSFNPATVEGIKLGRMLYYDPILGTNGNSCSSCHNQANAFSNGFLGPGNFSIPPHQNLAWNPDYTWEGAVQSLDHIAIVDLEVPDFIAPDMDLLLTKLTNHQEYPDLFKKAFNIDILTIDVEKRKLYIAYAIAQFMRTQISGDSKYDRVLRGEEFFTDSELNGYEIFFSEKGDCFHCHGTALFTDNLYHNNGIDSVFVGINKGKYMVTQDSADMGMFSSPTLRNVEFTQPYMHDGRMHTLEQVVEFYNSGVNKSATLDPIMTKPGKENGLQLSAKDKTDLVNFLKTLSDNNFITNPDLSTPF